MSNTGSAVKVEGQNPVQGSVLGTTMEETKPPITKSEEAEAAPAPEGGGSMFRKRKIPAGGSRGKRPS